MTVSENALDSHLEEALAAAEDELVCYHIREAMQLRVIERASADGSVSV